MVRRSVLVLPSQTSPPACSRIRAAEDGKSASFHRPIREFRAADGDFVLAVGNDDQWRRFCHVVGVADDGRFAARDMVAEGEHPVIGTIRLIGTPIKLSGMPAAVRTAPPTLGQHTEAVLRGDLGLSAADIDTLRSRGVI